MDWTTRTTIYTHSMLYVQINNKGMSHFCYIFSLHTAYCNHYYYNEKHLYCFFVEVNTSTSLYQLDRRGKERKRKRTSPDAPHHMHHHRRAGRGIELLLVEVPANTIFACVTTCRSNKSNAGWGYLRAYQRERASQMGDSFFQVFIQHNSIK